MYKTILVHVDASFQSGQRVAAAACLAHAYDAHLIGAAVTGVSAYVFPPSLIDPSMPAIVFPVAQLRAEADRALDQFAMQAEQAAVPAYERRRIDDEAGIGLSRHGRYADLIVLSQTNLDAPSPQVPTDLPESVLLHCARPLLIVPAAARTQWKPNSVVVAWNGSSNAVHAITSAIGILQRARAVHLLVPDAQADTDLHGAAPGAELALYLSRHGIEVEVTATTAYGEVGESLLAFAEQKGADLIVMGAYGRSRFRELALGGASRTALRSSPIALWMAH